jgi:hypothetical protein
LPQYFWQFSRFSLENLAPPSLPEYPAVSGRSRHGDVVVLKPGRSEEYQ